MEASKKPIRPDVRNLVLEICCTDTSGEDAEVPYIKYNFRWTRKKKIVIKTEWKAKRHSTNLDLLYKLLLLS